MPSSPLPLHRLFATELVQLLSVVQMSPTPRGLHPALSGRARNASLHAQTLVASVQMLLGIGVEQSSVVVQLLYNLPETLFI